jgi:hypothetical protein
MTIADMHIYFEMLTDKSGSLEYRGFEPEEIDLHLNKEISRFIKQRYGAVNATKTGFESTEKRTQDLRTLVTNIQLTGPAIDPDGKPNSVLFDFPANFWLSVNEELIYQKENCPGEFRMPIKPIRHDEYNEVMQNPFKRPSERKAVRTVIGDSLEVHYLPTGVLPLKVNLRYIRKFQEVSLDLQQDCDLPEMVHEEIVRLAAMAAIVTIGDNRNRPVTDFTTAQE